MIGENDLELLRSFDGQGNIMLSIYLRLDTPEHRDSAYEEFVRQMQVHLDACDPRPECREALQEDMEIVHLYLRTNGDRRRAGLAIFSCAAELFWRAYPLPVSIPTQVTVGPRFNIDPLMEVMGQQELA